MEQLSEPVGQPQAEVLRTQDGPARRWRLLRRLSLGRYTGVLLGLLIVCVYLSITQPVFLTWANWQNIIRSQAAVYALGIAMTFVVLGGGIDLSVGSMTAAAGMLLGLCIEHGSSWEIAAVAAVVGGALMGGINGFLVGRVRIPFFVVTLGTLSIYQSVAYLTTSGGQTISLYSYSRFAPIQSIADGNVGPFPTVLVIGAGIYLIAGFVLHLTRFGRAIYAVGSNAEAARLTGIRVPLIIFSVYVVSGLFAGLASVVQTGALTAASPTADPTLILTVIAAVLIGGTQFSGGEGGLVGTIIGVTFLGVVQNGLALSSITTFWQGMVSGVILIAAVGLGFLRQYGWKLPRRSPAPRGHEIDEPSESLHDRDG